MLREHPIKPYCYYQYGKYPDVQAIVESYNIDLQAFIDALQGLNFPFYRSLQGDLLDWCANSVFGLKRPVISTGNATLGSFAGQVISNSLVTNGFLKGESSIGFQKLSDDLFKKVIAWHVFKRDGIDFNIAWLKKRIARFIAEDFFDDNYNSSLISIELPVRKKIPYFGCIGMNLTNSIAINSFINPNIFFIDSNSKWTIKIKDNNPNSISFKWLMKSKMLEIPFCNDYEVIIDA
jgi:hypothetical protein